MVLNTTGHWQKAAANCPIDSEDWWRGWEELRFCLYPSQFSCHLHSVLTGRPSCGSIWKDRIFKPKQTVLPLPFFEDYALKKKNKQTKGQYVKYRILSQFPLAFLKQRKETQRCRQSVAAESHSLQTAYCPPHVWEKTMVILFQDSVPDTKSLWNIYS